MDSFKQVSNNLKICFGLADINLIKPYLVRIQWILDHNITYLVGNKREVELLNSYIKFPKNKTLCTQGSNGAKLDHIKVSAKPVKIKNSNGAGDALLGIFLSLLQEKGLQKSLEEAVKYASLVCEVEGPRL